MTSKLNDHNKRLPGGKEGTFMLKVVNMTRTKNQKR